MASNISKLLVTIIVVLGSVQLPAQETNGSSAQGSVSIARLFVPVYPPIAKTAQITGDVELTLTIRPDGTIESATVVSGPPMLQRAALESAQHSQFSCEDCDKEPRSIQMTYSFQLGPTVYCSDSSAPPKVDEPKESYPRLVELHNHITLYDRPVGTCDLAAKKVRSIKCLYLWKCGLADWCEEPLNVSH